MKGVRSLFLLIILISTINYAQFDVFSPTTSIGGYGELHYNYVKPDGEDATKTLDFHRFVMFYSHSWNEQWSFNSEIELEHNFVKDGHGELELEQAYVQYKYSKEFAVQAGVILPSVGLINETHEPPTFLSVERPEYSKYVIPTTWFGNGLSFIGNIKGFDYKVTIMEGLDGSKFSASSGIRSGRQKGFKANADELLYNARVNYVNIPGLLIGASVTYNNATVDSTNNNAITIIDLHAKYQANNIYAVAEFGNISYDNGPVETTQGFYVDFGYNVGSLFKVKTEIIPFIRYSDYNTAASTIIGGDSEKEHHRSILMFGAAVKPIPQVVVKIDYSQRTIELGDAKTDLLNIGVGYFF
jgi:hypothetical protein